MDGCRWGGGWVFRVSCVALFGECVWLGVYVCKKRLGTQCCTHRSSPPPPTPPAESVLVGCVGRIGRAQSPTGECINTLTRIAHYCGAKHPDRVDGVGRLHRRHRKTLRISVRQYMYEERLKVFGRRLQVVLLPSGK